MTVSLTDWHQFDRWSTCFRSPNRLCDRFPNQIDIKWLQSIDINWPLIDVFFRSRSRLCDRFPNQLTSIDRWRRVFDQAVLYDRFPNQLTSIWPFDRRVFDHLIASVIVSLIKLIFRDSQSRTNENVSLSERLTNASLNLLILDFRQRCWKSWNRNDDNYCTVETARTPSTRNNDYERFSKKLASRLSSPSE